VTYHTSHQIEAAEPDAVGIIVARYGDRLRRVDGEWKMMTILPLNRRSSHAPFVAEPPFAAGHRRPTSERTHRRPVPRTLSMIQAELS